MTLRNLFHPMLAGLGVAALVSGCATDLTPPDRDVGKTASSLYVSSGKIWPSGNISVCWESLPTDTVSVDGRRWVEDAVRRTWESVAAIDFRFSSSACTSTSKGIRINVVDSTSAPNSFVGTDLDGLAAGMDLNFTFDNWSPSCKSDAATREACIRSIAVHEFGHALGFEHEQRRADTPADCISDQQGLDANTTGDDDLAGVTVAGAVNFGDWDVSSVMNYCNPIWSNGGVLSGTDVDGARRYYSGNVHTHEIDPDGSIGEYVQLFEWSAGWSTVEFYAVGTKRFMMLMKTDGTVHLHQMNADGTVGTRFKDYAWSSGWTSAQFFAAGGTTYLLLLKKDTGTVKTFKMNSDGTVGTNLATYAWSTGWSSVKTFVAGGNNYLLLLKSSDGTMHVNKLNTNGTVGSQVQSASWSSGWTTAEPYDVGGKPFLLLVKSGDGSVNVNAVGADGKIGAKVKSYAWSSGWTSAPLYKAGGKTFLMLLKKGDGAVHFHAMNADGTVGSKLDERDWSSGWTTAEPYVTSSGPFMFLLKQ